MWSTVLLPSLTGYKLIRFHDDRYHRYILVEMPSTSIVLDAMRRRSPQAALDGGTGVSPAGRNVFSSEEAMEAADSPSTKSRVEQQGLLEIDDGSQEEPKKGMGAPNIFLVNDPLHSYQGRRRCIALMLVTGLLMVLYLGK